MKENSIEEIIKQLELILKVRKEQKEIIECAGGSCMNCDPDIKALTESIKIVSDYKRVLKENEELKIKNNAIKRESEAYAEHMIRLDNELNLEKEKSKYEWIRQNCLSQELVNKLYIPIQKIKDNIEKEIKYHERNILEIENITMLKSKTAKEEAEIEFNKYAIVVLKKILHELIKEEEENYEENI